MSPKPFKSCSTTFCSIRRIILPERVFGRCLTTCENDPKKRWRSGSVKFVSHVCFSLKTSEAELPGCSLDRHTWRSFWTLRHSVAGASPSLEGPHPFLAPQRHTHLTTQKEKNVLSLTSVPQKLCNFLKILHWKKCLLLTLSFDVMWVSYDSRLGHIRTLILLQESTRV